MNRIAIALLCVSLTASTFADDPANKNGTTLDEKQSDALLERAISESSEEGSDCDDETLLSCLNIDQKQCGTLLASVLEECTMPLARKILSSSDIATGDIELEHAKCTFTLAQRDYSVTPKRYMSCMPEGSFQNPQAIEDWLENH